LRFGLSKREWERDPRTLKSTDTLERCDVVSGRKNSLIGERVLMFVTVTGLVWEESNCLGRSLENEKPSS
jgi:hypothetical protein